MPDSPETDRLVEYYSRRAPEYDRVYDKPERQADLATLRDQVRDLLRGHDVLEVACGTGYWTEVMAPVVRSVVATDLSAAVLERARAREFTNPAVRFARTDAFALHGVSGTFSATFAGFLWSHVPRRRLAVLVQSVSRRVRPGGRMVFLDNAFVAGSSTPIVARDAAGDTYQDRVLDDGSAHRVLKNFPDERELRDTVRAVHPDVVADVVFLQHYWSLSYTLPAVPE